MKATLDGADVAYTCDACNTPAVRLTQDTHNRWSAWCPEHRPRIPPAAALPVSYAGSLEVLISAMARIAEQRRERRG